MFACCSAERQYAHMLTDQACPLRLVHGQSPPHVAEQAHCCIAKVAVCITVALVADILQRVRAGGG